MVALAWELFLVVEVVTSQDQIKELYLKIILRCEVRGHGRPVRTLKPVVK
jgi:hypothetical protein